VGVGVDAPGVHVSVIPGLDGNWAENPTCHTLGGWMSTRAAIPMTLESAAPLTLPHSATTTVSVAQTGLISGAQITGGFETPEDPSDWASPELRAYEPLPDSVMTWSLTMRCALAARAEVTLITVDATGTQHDRVIEAFDLVAGVAKRVGCTLLTTTGAAGAFLQVLVTTPTGTGTVAVGTATTYDNLLIEPDSGRAWVPPDVNGYHPAGVYDPARYCDGDTSGYTWTGVVGESITVLEVVEPAPPIVPPPVLAPPRPTTLGCGQLTAYLYDRGGQQRLYRFEAGAVVSADWTRVLSDTGSATLIVDAALCDCDWLGRIRAVRHELVLYRDNQRVWEGPITRIAYSQTRVTIIAKDVSWWFHKRAVLRTFATGNAVSLALGYAQQALVHDNPNARAFLQANLNRGETITTAHNDADGYVIDALDELVEAGIDWAVLGRRVFFWASVNPVGRTNLIRTPTDLAAEVTVFEDGESLVTRAFATGGDTWGASILAGADTTPATPVPLPVTVNWAANPSLRINTIGFAPYTTRFFTVTRLTSGWASAAGGTFGKVGVKIPGSGQARSDYNQYEMVLSMKDQEIAVAPGEQISATLTVRPTGVNFTRLSLALRGRYKDGTVDDRPFVEGPPVQTKSATDALLFVVGVVPDDMVACWVEVSRETSEVQWKNAADGFWFDRFGLWRGRIETWFDGDSAKTADYSYTWSSTPGQSASTRYYHSLAPRAPQDWPTETEYQERVSPYYGIIDHIEDSSMKTRVDLEAAAKATIMRSFPTPLGIDIPQNAPLLPAAPVTINELMPGTIVPLQTRATCRQVGAMPVLETVRASYRPSGEKITVTLLTSQAWEIDPPVDPGTDPDLTDDSEGNHPE